jgi:hypothetical protein
MRGEFMTQLEIMTMVAITSFVLAAISAMTCGGLLAYIKHLNKRIK